LRGLESSEAFGSSADRLTGAAEQLAHERTTTLPPSFAQLPIDLDLGKARDCSAAASCADAPSRVRARIT
jgi:hypothetical protein